MTVLLISDGIGEEQCIGEIEKNREPPFFGLTEKENRHILPARHTRQNLITFY